MISAILSSTKTTQQGLVLKAPRCTSNHHKPSQRRVGVQIYRRFRDDCRGIRCSWYAVRYHVTSLSRVYAVLAYHQSLHKRAATAAERIQQQGERQLQENNDNNHKDYYEYYYYYYFDLKCCWRNDAELRHARTQAGKRLNDSSGCSRGWAQ